MYFSFQCYILRHTYGLMYHVHVLLYEAGQLRPVTLRYCSTLKYCATLIYCATLKDCATLICCVASAQGYHKCSEIKDCATLICCVTSTQVLEV